MKKTNCINCGAPLAGNVCKYCGTRYEDNKVKAEFDTDNWYGTLTVGNVTFQVYIQEIECEMLYADCLGRDIDGRMTRGPMAMKRRFVLVER